ncbi:uncharacterized protein LOC100374208 isoform X2 [Saccoglossus kowalevskii]|uniref:Uncharacterized protein LOC100374208 isoform 2 n=1 Tax=Saccoglossus kowalevskii TaxID=10224 RepID=A0ABM0GIQ3_SACKO|nr:PREDICTED: uncharacterized protein LOC100374208 isoform 2 [Saccoglossus kowalevskii]
MDKDTIMIVIITVACIVVFVILVVFLVVAWHVIKRRNKEVDEIQHVTDVDEVDAVIRAEVGKHEHTITSNPAYGKEDLVEAENGLPSVPVDLAREFDGDFEEGKEVSETGSNYSFTPENLEDGYKNKLSILDKNTWGGVHMNTSEADAEFDFNMFHPIRGIHSKSDGNLHNSSLQRGHHNVADLYEAGQALTVNGGFPVTNPCLNNTTGSRLLWQKKRFKNF